MKTRNLRFTHIVEDFERLAAAIRRAKVRRYGAVGAIVADSRVPASMDRWAVGNRFGQFRELIIRREVRTDGVPTWFDAKENPAHVGYIDRQGLRVYVELEVDAARRSQPSTFDREVLTLAEAAPKQPGLFG